MSRQFEIQNSSISSTTNNRLFSLRKRILMERGSLGSNRVQCREITSTSCELNQRLCMVEKNAIRCGMIECNTIVRGLGGIILHLLHHTFPDIYECFYCNEILIPSKIRNVVDHLNLHDEVLFHCLNCAFVIGDEKSMMIHMSEKHNDVPIEFNKYTRRINYDIVEQNITMLLKCMRCSENFISISNADKHMIECKIDGAKGFESISVAKQLNETTYNYSSGTVYREVLSCGVCTEQFLQVDSIIAHSRDMHDVLNPIHSVEWLSQENVHWLEN